MISLTYYDSYKNMKNIYNIRYQIVKYALSHCVSAAAREFSTTRKTVRKWRDRYLVCGVKGLEDRSRAPKNIPHKLSEEMENKILQIRKTRPYLGPYRIINEFNINASYGAVARVLRDNNLTRGKKKKHLVKRDLRVVKEKLRPFQKIQIDIKELKDIPNYLPYTILKKFPKYQFSARDVRTGISFVCYGYEKSSTNMGIFFLYLLNHLKDNGIKLDEISFQSDNGAEFIGSSKAKHKLTPYLKLAELLNVKTEFIPPASPTYNSDVEAFHAIIENEFYDIENYDNIYDFLFKAFSYSLYFNFSRKFRYKHGATPFDILSKYKNFNRRFSILCFFPLILDSLITFFNFSFSNTGYHVPISYRCYY